jgi:uncharacterized membrane protein SirB2
MEVFYPQIRLVHILCVSASGGLFALRGILMLAGRAAARHAGLRLLSYAVDTALLTAAFMLMTITHQYPFVQAWLTVKLLLVVLYVVLGVIALRAGRTQRSRALAFGAAMAVFLAVVGIARAHDPLGFLRLP